MSLLVLLVRTFCALGGFAMKKVLFLAVASLGFFGVDANAGIFKKKCKSCSSCQSCQSSKAGADAGKTQAAAPQKKVEAPSPVKAQDGGKAQSATPAKTGKKVAAPQQ